MITLVGSAAVAGTGVGKVFNLGESNRVNARSQLEGATPSAVLNVTNSDKSSTASGVSIDVPSSDPPLVVNSTTKVKNLNADLLDGQSSSQFQDATSTACPNDTAIASMKPNGTTTCSSSVVQPIDDHLPPTNAFSPGFAFQPSTLGLGFGCTMTTASFGFGNNGSAPATLSSTDFNGTSTFMGNQSLTSTGGIVATAAPQIVGEYIYYDQTTVATVNISAISEGRTAASSTALSRLHCGRPERTEDGLELAVVADTAPSDASSTSSHPQPQSLDPALPPARWRAVTRSSP